MRTGSHAVNQSPPVEETEALRSAFATAFGGRTVANSAVVHERVSAFVDVLKAAGWSAEAVVIEVRRVARAAEAPAYQPAIVADAVRWSIKHYYAVA